jgi:hypothetical protein
VKPHLNGKKKKKKLGVVVHTCHPSNSRKLKIGRSMVQMGLGKK